MLRLSKKAFHLNTYHIVCCFPDDNPFLGQDIGPIVGKWFQVHWDFKVAILLVLKSFRNFFQNLLGCWSVVEKKLPKHGSWKTERCGLDFTHLEKMHRKTVIWTGFSLQLFAFLRLLMKIKNYKFIWNLEVYASVEQILHHGRVFVCGRHVQNILSIVPGW